MPQRPSKEATPRGHRLHLNSGRVVCACTTVWPRVVCRLLSLVPRPSSLVSAFSARSMRSSSSSSIYSLINSKQPLHLAASLTVTSRPSPQSGKRNYAEDSLQGSRATRGAQLSPKQARQKSPAGNPNQSVRAMHAQGDARTDRRRASSAIRRASAASAPGSSQHAMRVPCQST